MTEQTGPSVEKIISREDKIRHSAMKAHMILLRCQRKDIQPRDLLTKAFIESERSDSLALRLNQIVSEMPEYDLSNRADFIKAKEYITNIFTIIVDENPLEQVINDTEAKNKWIDGGFFSYEIGDENNIFLHIPSTTESPSLHQIKDSLHKVADFLVKNPDIVEVSGSSLLLEHPVFAKLGFKIDFESEGGFNPSFKMSRDDFLKAFKK